MDSYKTILTKQKLGGESLTTPIPVLRPNATATLTQAGLSVMDSSIDQPNPALQATSRLYGVAHSPAAQAPLTSPPPTESLLPETHVLSIFDTLSDKQVTYSNEAIRKMSFKAEMFTRDEVRRLPSGSVFMHSDGVLRYHREVLGEIRQTPLFLMEE